MAISKHTKDVSLYPNVVKMTGIDINLTTITNTQILRERKNQHTVYFIRADSHDTTLSHATSLRQVYDMSCFV